MSDQTETHQDVIGIALFRLGTVYLTYSDGTVDTPLTGLSEHVEDGIFSEEYTLPYSIMKQALLLMDGDVKDSRRHDNRTIRKNMAEVGSISDPPIDQIRIFKSEPGYIDFAIGTDMSDEGKEGEKYSWQRIVYSGEYQVWYGWETATKKNI